GDRKVLVMGDGHANAGSSAAGEQSTTCYCEGKREPLRRRRLANATCTRYTLTFRESGCESGGIGRRTGFRFQRGSPWGFESPLSHHVTTLARIRRACKPVSKR